jgi:hypothetical protein
VKEDDRDLLLAFARRAGAQAGTDAGGRADPPLSGRAAGAEGAWQVLAWQLLRWARLPAPHEARLQMLPLPCQT